MLNRLASPWLGFAAGVAFGAVIAIGATRLLWREQKLSYLDSLPWALGQVDDICRYHLAGNWLTDGDGADHTYELQRWNRFAEGVDIIATTFEEVSLVCIEDDAGVGNVAADSVQRA